MDIREKIINEVLGDIRGKIPGDSLSLVQDALVIRLNQYELQERCTDVALVDSTPEKLLRKFIATKRIEGLAESTLRRYYETNIELIQFLRKPLNEISTYDLRFYLSFRRQNGRVSNRSLDGMRRCYSSFFKWLAAEELITRNPCAALADRKSVV